MKKLDFRELVDRDLSKLQWDEQKSRRVLLSVSGKEVKMRRFTIRTVCIAAAILLLTIAVGMAASGVFGWTDFLSSFDSVSVPDEAVQKMQVEKAESIVVGPCTFTLNEQLTDPHIAVNAMAIEMTDHSKALFMPIDADVTDKIGFMQSSADMAKALGISPDVTWGEAAKLLNMPLYSARALIEVDGVLSMGEAMEDPLWDENGSIVYFNMQMLNPEAMGDILPFRYYLRVAKIDPDSGETMEKWINNEREGSIAVQKMLSEKSYQFDSSAAFLDLPLVSVVSQQYVTGVYVKITVSKSADIQVEYLDWGDVSFTDALGAPLPEGMSLSAWITEDNPNQLSFTYMLGINEIPDTMNIKAYGSVIQLK